MRNINSNFHPLCLSIASPHPNLGGKPCLKLKVYVKPTSEYVPASARCVCSLSIYVIYSDTCKSVPGISHPRPRVLFDLTEHVNPGNSVNTCINSSDG